MRFGKFVIVFCHEVPDGWDAFGRVYVWIHSDCVGGEETGGRRYAAKLSEFVDDVVGVFYVAQDDGGEDMELAGEED